VSSKLVALSLIHGARDIGEGLEGGFDRWQALHT
jgi:hypothetical protein